MLKKEGDKTVMQQKIELFPIEQGNLFDQKFYQKNNWDNLLNFVQLIPVEYCLINTPLPVSYNFIQSNNKLYYYHKTFHKWLKWAKNNVKLYIIPPFLVNNKHILNYPIVNVSNLNMLSLFNNAANSPNINKILSQQLKLEYNHTLFAEWINTVDLIYKNIIWPLNNVFKKYQNNNIWAKNLNTAFHAPFYFNSLYNIIHYFIFITYGVKLTYDIFKYNPNTIKFDAKIDNFINAYDILCRHDPIFQSMLYIISVLELIRHTLYNLQNDNKLYRAYILNLLNATKINFKLWHDITMRGFDFDIQFIKIGVNIK